MKNKGRWSTDQVEFKVSGIEEMLETCNEVEEEGNGTVESKNLDQSKLNDWESDDENIESSNEEEANQTDVFDENYVDQLLGSAEMLEDACCKKVDEVEKDFASEEES